METAVLRGVSQVSLDAKGRFAVPQRYRDALGVRDDPTADTRLVMTADPNPPPPPEST